MTKKNKTGIRKSIVTKVWPSRHMVSALTLLLTSCGAPNAWHSNQTGSRGNREAGHFHPQPPPPGSKYPYYGHQTTTYVVARIAGWDQETSLRLSHFSQAPDDLAISYSAPAVAVWGTLIPGAWNYRHRVMNVLHSLHGGDAAAVDRRRERLHGLIAASNKADREQHWKTGFLIHAYGDSYAHVRPNSQGGERAYGELVGHGFDRHVKPDHISEHFPMYEIYVGQLHAALAKNGGNPAELKRFVATVKADSHSEKTTEDAICNFAPFGRKLPGKSYSEWNEEIEDVSTYLQAVEKSL